MTNKDAFDLWWEWADKPVDNKPTIDAAIYDAVMALPPDERRDREKVGSARWPRSWPGAFCRHSGPVRRSEGDGMIEVSPWLYCSRPQVALGCGQRR
jgi:hypothetical protein